MFVLQPSYHETVWGGTRLLAYCNGYSGKQLAHLYSVYCRENTSNYILNGNWKGKSLNQLFSEVKETWKMAEYKYFPLTIALVDARENLSIQVHPDNLVALEMENESLGKRESWLFLEAPDSGEIYNGCKCQSKEELRESLENNKDIIECFDTLKVKKGDYVYCESGTLHALTAGSLVYEIEEGSDYTYRIHDYNRTDSEGKTREIHIEKALKALDLELKSGIKRYEENSLISEETYETHKYENISHYVNQSDEVECFTLIEGECVCDGIVCGKGMTILLLPGEEITSNHLKVVVVARLRREK